MTALAKSPLADAMREAGLNEEQITAAIRAAEQAKADGPLKAMTERAQALGAIVVKETGNHGVGDWLRIDLADAGDLAWFPSNNNQWIFTVKCRPDAVPSPMARAQRLYDLHQKLVTP